MRERTRSLEETTEGGPSNGTDAEKTRSQSIRRAIDQIPRSRPNTIVPIPSISGTEEERKEGRGEGEFVLTRADKTRLEVRTGHEWI